MRKTITKGELGCALAVLLSIFFPFAAGAEGDAAALEALYDAAIRDAMTIESEEILPLIEIAPDSAMCTWDENGRVLMITYHRHPESYIPGEEYTLTYGEVWTFTDREIVAWYGQNRAGVEDWATRFEQLIGLPPSGGYTHFTALWVDPENILRPGYAYKLSDAVGASSFAGEPPAAYKAWFDENIIWSYFDSAYPWTRLGYTYDWADNDTEYGLSEFLVEANAVTQVEFTLSTEEFLAWMDAELVG